MSGSFTININQLTGNHHAKLSFIQAKIIELSKKIVVFKSYGRYSEFNGTKPAETLRLALVDKFKGRWYIVAAMEADEVFSTSGVVSVIGRIFKKCPVCRRGYKDYVNLTYKGIRWDIFSY